MRIAVIGANGQLGTDLGRQLQGDLVAFGRRELDVSREDLVAAALADARADLVINCAALTNVDACEDRVDAALAVNAGGALAVARQADRLGAAVLYVSTDYVFGIEGARQEPYTEEATPGPINVYGATKLTGEHLTRAYSRRCYVVRTSGLYGHVGALAKGGNLVETMLRLAGEGKPLRVVDDQRLAPTGTRELAARICALIQTEAFGLYHVASPDSCTWFEFAREIFRHEQLEVDLRPIASSEFPTRARRPFMSALNSKRLSRAGLASCPPWREMLHAYLQTREPA